MSSTTTGRQAESYVANQLGKQGYKLLDQNWRTKWCEIDLVMQKKSVVYFIEVKYRRSAGYGSGLDYITPKKLKQMEFAAELWASNSEWDGGMMLAAVEVSSDLNGQIEMIEIS